MSKEKHYYRYKVTHVTGCIEGRLEVGATLVDIWYGKSHTWQIFDMNVAEVTGTHNGDLIRRVTEPDVLAQLGA